MSGPAPYVISLAGGKLRKAVCKRCGREAAWTTSKAGRWYLCSLIPKAGDNPYRVMRAAPWMPHRCQEAS